MEPVQNGADFKDRFLRSGCVTALFQKKGWSLLYTTLLALDFNIGFSANLTLSVEESTVPVEESTL